MILRGIVVLAALMLSGGTVSAEKDFRSANYFMPGCRSFADKIQADLFLSGICMGSIEGVLYGRSEVCPPKEVTGGQLARVVVQYIDARPARMHEDFRKLALEAVKAAWPCQRQ